MTERGKGIQLQSKETNNTSMPEGRTRIQKRAVEAVEQAYCYRGEGYMGGVLH